MPEYSYNNLHVLNELKYLRALPFVDLNINTWQVNRLSFMLILSSIIFKNKYSFALKTNTRYRYKKYMPYYIKDSEKKKSKKENLKIKNTKKNDNPVIKSIKKKYDEDEDENQILKDPYLVLCSLAKKDMDVDKYIKYISIAYNENNYYPVLIYPKTLTILNYNDKNDTILFKPLLEPISNKHNMNFIT
jgi:hydroxylamine reductase (hybrid-cluster protein)